ncbi:MAG TPA: M24 family metallopeptidase [Candidatus Acidoferrales bacterium]|nr:M24 family metallopeptidase [Candidatus Acidoferrales bacterium]
MNLPKIQEEIRRQKLDGWLFFDHHLRDPLAYRVLGMTVTKGPSRRWYYMIPAVGEPKGMEHRIERNQLAALPGEKIAYSSWPEQAAALRSLTAGMKRVAMQYSPMCAVPYVANVDAGTVELVRNTGVEVVSSAELIQIFEAQWTPEQLESHLEAGRRVDKVRASAFEVIRERTRNGLAVQEVEIKDFVRGEFAKAGLITDSGPIVGCNANASNPHYEPGADVTVPIKRGDWVLLDMWAKLDRPRAVYYDITWTAFCGENPTEEMCKVFEIVKSGRDAAIEKVQTTTAAKQTLRGFEVDDACRAVIGASGYGEYFTHRTGHSIGVEVHGNGANMDNFETHDDRRVIPWTCFSVEPGIYLPHFGVRSEVNMFVGDGEAGVTGQVQRGMVLL